MVSFFGTETSPSSGASSPTIIRNSVVLPDPLGPTRPTFAPGLSWNDASTKRICFPYCLLILVNETIACYLSLTPKIRRRIEDDSKETLLVHVLRCASDSSILRVTRQAAATRPT